MIGEALDHTVKVFAKIFATVCVIATIAIVYIILTWNKGKEIVSEHLLKPEKSSTNRKTK